MDGGERIGGEKSKSQMNTPIIYPERGQSHDQRMTQEPSTHGNDDSATLGHSTAHQTQPSIQIMKHVSSTSKELTRISHIAEKSPTSITSYHIRVETREVSPQGISPWMFQNTIKSETDEEETNQSLMDR